MPPALHANPLLVAWRYTLRGIIALVLLYLVLPIFVIVPISFTSSTLLIFPIPGYSLRWYEDFFSNPIWLDALKNSLIVGVQATILATVLGTLAALGLARSRFRYKSAILAVIVSPMVVPIVIVAVGVYFFYSWLGLANSLFGLVLAHTALGAPFVVITVTATLQGFDTNLMRAGVSLGAPPWRVFFRVVLPLILPGVLSGALFAFTTSFDEIVVALFLTAPDQRTLPRQIFSGIRENISPTIAAVATLLVMVSIALMASTELLRRRSERLRGVTRE